MSDMNDAEDGWEDYLKTMKKHGFEPLMTREQFRESFGSKSRDDIEDENQAMIKYPVHKDKNNRK